MLKYLKRFLRHSGWPLLALLVCLITLCALIHSEYSMFVHRQSVDNPAGQPQYPGHHVAKRKISYATSAKLVSILGVSVAIKNTMMWKKPKCRPQHNIAFIKTHKTGSHIITNILQRYGNKHDLNFVLPKLHPGGYRETHILGWPKDFSENHIEQISSVHYNILCNHARYSGRMRSLMPPDTKFVTILSDPAAQVYLMYRNLKLDRDYGTTFEDFINNYQNFLPKYRGKLPIGVLTKNSMAYDLGIDNMQTNRYALNDYMHKLHKELNLVLIAEYMEESLVLLAREFCWSLNDVLYMPLRMLKPKPLLQMSESLKDKVRTHSNLDTMMYQYFNKTFWDKIHSYGSEFQRDVQILHKKLQHISETCLDGPRHVSINIMAVKKLTRWRHGGQIKVFRLKANAVSNPMCTRMILSDEQYTERLRRLQQIKLGFR